MSPSAVIPASPIAMIRADSRSVSPTATSTPVSAEAIAYAMSCVVLRADAAFAASSSSSDAPRAATLRCGMALPIAMPASTSTPAQASTRPGEAPDNHASLELPSSLRAEFVEQKLARPETIPFFELREKMRVAWSFGLNANGFAMQFHSLLALPMLLVAMTLIAATVSMRFARMGQSVTMILGGILAGFLLYVVSVLVKAFGTAGIVPPLVAAWIPVVIAMFFGVTFLLYREDG